MQKSDNRRQLGKYSNGIQAGSGWITSHLTGRRIESSRAEDSWLIIRFWDHHEARIGWQNKSGNQITGKPFLYSQAWGFLEQKIIEQMLIDGVWLILEFTDGSEARVGWADPVKKQQHKGEPFLENLDVKVFITGAAMSGIGNAPR